MDYKQECSRCGRRVIPARLYEAGRRICVSDPACKPRTPGARQLNKQDPKHATIDGRPFTRIGLAHSCPVAPLGAASIYRDDAYPTGQMGGTACRHCDFRRTPDGNEQDLITAKAAVLAAFGINERTH